MNGARLYASYLGEALPNDHQLQIPERPMLAPGLQFEIGDALAVVVNGHQPIVLRGKGVASVLRALLPLLSTGRLTESEICDVLSLPQAAVANAIAMLYTQGALIESLSEDLMVPSALWASRFVDQERRHGHGVAAIKQMACLKIGIATTDVMFDSIARALQGSSSAAVRIDLDGLNSDLSVACIVADTCLQDADRAAVMRLAAKTPVLVVRMSADELTLGPVVHREDACLDCADAVLSWSNDPQSPASTQDLWASMVALELLAIGSRAFAVSTGTHARVLGPIGELIRTHRITRRPDCKNCVSVPGNVPELSRAIWRYEEESSVPSALFVNPRHWQAHYAPMNLARAMDSLHVPYAGERIKFAGARGGANALGELLRFGFGFEASGHRRLAPTGGNLGSSEAVIVSSGKYLAAGCYMYEPQQHCLARLSATQVELLPSSWDLGLLHVANHGKVQDKYGPRGLRISLFDGGAALAYLVAAAQRLSIDLHAATEVDVLGARDVLFAAGNWPGRQVLYGCHISVGRAQDA